MTTVIFSKNGTKARIILFYSTVWEAHLSLHSQGERSKK